jgi:hypothetical protein
VLWRFGAWWCVENQWNPVAGFGTGELLVFERHIESLEECTAQELGDLVEALWYRQSAAAKVLRFTNVGTTSGASQSHLHSQRVRVDLDGGRGALGEHAWREDMQRAEDVDLMVATGDSWQAYVAPAPQFFGEVRVVAGGAVALGEGVGETLGIIDDFPVSYNVIWHHLGDLWGAQILVSRVLPLYKELVDVVLVRIPVESWAKDIQARFALNLALREQ